MMMCPENCGCSIIPEDRPATHCGCYGLCRAPGPDPFCRAHGLPISFVVDGGPAAVGACALCVGDVVREYTRNTETSVHPVPDSLELPLPRLQQISDMMERWLQRDPDPSDEDRLRKWRLFLMLTNPESELLILDLGRGVVL